VMNMSQEIPASTFTADLVFLNKLSSFFKWHFEKGMGFGENDTWWRGVGVRTHPHEGVDLCYYTNVRGRRVYLGLDTYIPPLYPGEVIKVFDDFIGQTILLKHVFFNEKDCQLYSMYGHVNPLFHITAGQEIDCTEKIATIADTALKNRPMLSHLHISTLWLPRSFPAETVEWGMENDTAVRFCDPLEFFE
jgi:hypothetical protein